MPNNFKSHILYILLFIASLYVFTRSAKGEEQSIQLTAPTRFFQEQQGEWDRLAYIIKTTPARYITITWAGDGGRVDLGKKIIEAVEQAKAQGKVIRIVVIGRAISMHAVVICHASNYELKSGGYLLFHAARNVFGSVSENVSREILDPCIGIISKAEEDRIIYEHKALTIHANGSRTWEQEH